MPIDNSGNDIPQSEQTRNIKPNTLKNQTLEDKTKSFLKIIKKCIKDVISGEGFRILKWIGI